MEVIVCDHCQQRLASHGSARITVQERNGPSIMLNRAPVDLCAECYALVSQVFQPRKEEP